MVWEGVGCSAKLFQLLLMSFFTLQRSAVTFFFFHFKRNEKLEAEAKSAIEKFEEVRESSC